MLHIRTFVLVGSTVLAGLYAQPAAAQLHAGDVELDVINGKIVTGSHVDGPGGEFFDPNFVFEAELGELIPNEVDEPGFDNEVGTFPPGSSLTFHLLDTLRKWDGNDFDLIPTETMGVAFGSSLGPVTTPLVPSIVDGFSLNVASDGSWHRHFDFLLNSPQSTGIYLLTMGLSSSDPGLRASDPFFIVFNQNDSEANHEAALEYVSANLVVPEPSTGVLAAMGVLLLGGAAWRRRRPGAFR